MELPDFSFDELTLTAMWKEDPTRMSRKEERTIKRLEMMVPRTKALAVKIKTRREVQGIF